MISEILQYFIGLCIGFTMVAIWDIAWNINKIRIQLNDSKSKKTRR